MTNRQNVEAAMRCRAACKAPLWEIEFHCWDQVSGRHVVLGREMEQLDGPQRLRAVEANAEIMAGVVRELGFSMLTVPGGYWEIAPGEPAYYWVPEDVRIAQIQALRKAVGDDVLLVGSSGGVMAMPSAEEYLDFSYRLYDDPQSIDQRARETLAWGIGSAKRLRDAGLDALFTASDIADNHGPFFNPQQMERFILPYLRDWAAQVKAMGLYAILHTDGNIAPCLEPIIASGIDALQAIDPVAGMDIVSVKKAAAGRVCLCGNVDCGLLQQGPPQKVYDATRKLLESCGGGGLILGASNAVQVETPAAHYLAMIQAWRDCTSRPGS